MLYQADLKPNQPENLIFAKRALLKVMKTSFKEKILQFLLPYEPASIAIFGSYARGNHTKDSDLDILVRFKESISLLKLVQIEQALSDHLGIKIDLVTENSLKHPIIKENIQKDLIKILG